MDSRESCHPTGSTTLTKVRLAISLETSMLDPVNPMVGFVSIDGRQL